MQSFIIITAANAQFFELVQGTILSIRQKPKGQDVIIGFFDLGCTPEQLEWLQRQVNTIKQADWEFNFPLQNEAPEYLKGLLARPFLRQYFPNFDIYLWIDADAWVQDWKAIDLFIQGAERRGLAIVPEIDRASQIQYGGLPEYWWTWVYRHYQESFGEEVAQNLYSYPLLNAGVFALHKDAPHWQVWAEYLEEGLQRDASLMTDQLALNVAVYKGGLFGETEMLPVGCNWLCHICLPSWDKKKGCFVEPYLPQTPIGILHLTREKYEREKVVATDRTEVEVSFRYASQDEYSESEGLDSKSKPGKEQVGKMFTQQQVKEHLPEHFQHPIVSDGKNSINLSGIDQTLNRLLDTLEKIYPQITSQSEVQEFDRKPEIVKLRQQGKEFFIKGDFEEALVIFNDLIKLYPLSWIANKHLNWLSWSKGDFEGSLKHSILAQLGNRGIGSDRTDEFQKILLVIRPYTLLREPRLFSLYSLAKQICLDDIPGNFVECGTWRGGTAALLAFVIKNYSLRPRLLYAFDTFEGMPDPTDVDRHNGTPANDTFFGAGTLKAPILDGLDPVCRALNVRDIVVPVQGLFSQTLPQHKPQIANIALLHADGDWYESTLDIFNNLFEQVVDDGIIQIDDYGFWEGCRKATHEFERSQGGAFALRNIDGEGVWFRKENRDCADCDHWRTFWYLAQAAEKMGDIGLAEKAARATLKLVPSLATAEEMLARLQTSPLNEELNLKEINLIIFPDWTQPEALLLADLESVIRVLLTHPDRSYVTLLVDTSNISKEDADLAISSVVMKLLYEEDLDLAEQPDISLVGTLSTLEWKALSNQIHTLIRINNENSLAIAKAGMEGLKSCKIATLSKQRAYQSETGIWQLIS